MRRLDRMTPMPDCLFDDLMRVLTDTEFRLLCLVARHTLGWRDVKTEVRKERDWISHQQLKQQTGRASAALSRAIDGLCRQGLIEVENRERQPLPTRALRRRHQGRLYFRLARTVIEGNIPGDPAKKRIPKAKRTTRHSDNTVVVFAKDESLPILERKDVRSRQIQRDWQRVGELLKAKRYDRLRRGRP